MHVEMTQVTKLAITDLDRIDPIHVYLEDIRAGAGRITINCYSESWTAYWGSMSCPIAEFFCACDEHYLAKNLSKIPGSVFDEDGLDRLAKKTIFKMRRDKDISQTDARELFDELDRGDITDPFSEPKLMQQIFGEDWVYALPQKANPDYLYLCRIIHAVQEALTIANFDVAATCDTPASDGVGGQDGKSYTDTQDRDNYGA